MPNRIPVEVIFAPNWWYQNYGISFDESFYLDPDIRVRNDVTMRRVLYERFGLGRPDPQPRPMIGSRHVAGGFVIPALLGVEIKFSANQAPWNVPRNLPPEEIRQLRLPDLETTWPMREIIPQARRLREQHGRLVGDWNTGGLINTALELRGNDLFLDFTDDPALVHFLVELIAQVQIRVVQFFHEMSGTSSVSVNRGIVNADPGIYLHSNCSTQMISPRTYAGYFLPYEMRLAAALSPYGIHHCGSNLQLFAPHYARLPLRFLDVGWGSDVKKVREHLPRTFFNLRLSPVRMLQESAEAIRRDTMKLLAEGYTPGLTGVCCINMDYGTPDENVRAMLDAVSEFSNLLEG